MSANYLKIEFEARDHPSTPRKCVMSMNKLRFAGLTVLMCSFVALPAQQSASPPSLLPVPEPQQKPAAIAVDDVFRDVPQAPAFVPKGQKDAFPFGATEKPQSPATIGAIWDRQVQALEAKDSEIRKVEEHLNQLRKQRNELAATLAETARKLAPMVQKAQEVDGKPVSVPASPPPPNLIPGREKC